MAQSTEDILAFAQTGGVRRMREELLESSLLLWASDRKDQGCGQ